MLSCSAILSSFNLIHPNSDNFLFGSFLLRQKRTKKGAPKTIPAGFGWFFGDLLYTEVKGSGALVRDPYPTAAFIIVQPCS
jgi:hypothetical protein